MLDARAFGFINFFFFFFSHQPVDLVDDGAAAAGTRRIFNMTFVYVCVYNIGRILHLYIQTGSTLVIFEDEEEEVEEKACWTEIRVESINPGEGYKERKHAKASSV